MNVHDRSPRLTPELEVQDIRSPLTEVAWQAPSAGQGVGADAFVLLAGTGAVRAGETEAMIAAPCVIWLPGGDAGVRLAAGARGARMRVSGAALGRVVPLSGLSTSFRGVLEHPMLGTPVAADAARRLAADLAEIGHELALDLPGGREACAARLQLVLIALWRLGRPETQETTASPRILVEHFLQQVELNIRRHWRIGEYAKALGVTPDRLVTAVERATGTTPSELVHRRLTEEAQQLLARSSLQVAEVATALGFKDAGYFNRFFTRRCGVAPGRYRAQITKDRAAGSGSYAAWP